MFVVRKMNTHIIYVYISVGHETFSCLQDEYPLFTFIYP